LLPDGFLVASVPDRACRRPETVAGQWLFRARAAPSLCTTMAAISSYPWPSLRATRSRACGSGPRVGACRRIGRGCIRGRKVGVAVGCGEACGQT